MSIERAGRIARILRVRARLTQAALARRAGVTRQQVSRLERGLGRGLTFGAIESILAALGARLTPGVLWNGPELDRLLDAGHATLAALVKRRLERWGWLVQVEASYSWYGERGRIDLLAFHPGTATVLVVEIKTELVDVQQTLGTLDAKARLAPRVAAQFGWRPRAVVPALVFAEDRTTRKRIAGLEALFERFAIRGRQALTWLRRPSAAPTGLLWFAQIARPSARPAKRRVYPSRAAA
jgi:transcriptional regulator with XRE-family HTH domain